MRVLFTSTFGTGHLNPLIPLGSAARGAGHTVAFAVPQMLAPRLEALGFAVLPAGLSPADSSVQQILQGLARDGRSTTVGKVFVDALAQHMLGVLPQQIDGFKPDVIVSELLELAGPLVAEQRGLPAVVFAFGGAVEFEELAARAGDAWPRLRASAGLPGDPVQAIKRLPMLVAAPKSFSCPEVAALSPFYFRPGGGDSIADARVEWIRELEGAPTIYVTLGTAEASRAPGLLEAFVARLAPLAKNLIVTCGPLRDPASLSGYGEHVRVETYVPHSALLPHCDLVMAHAGYGTTMDCLRYGVPMLLLPFAADQPMNAEAARRMGLSQTIERDPKAVAAVADVARRVLGDPGYAERAGQAARELQAMPGAEAAVEFIADRASRGAS